LIPAAAALWTTEAGLASEVKYRRQRSWLVSGT
jgi:hypothetical protein